MALNLGSILETTTRYFAGEVALIHDDRRLSYAELRSRVRAVARYLHEAGVERGDRVALFLPNRMSFTVAYYAVLYTGAVVVPISYLSVGREIAYALRDSDAMALIAWCEYEAAAREGFERVESCRKLFLIDESRGPVTVLNDEPVERDRPFDVAQTRPDDTAVILYTSGTTGEPKGAELTHFNLYSNAQYAGERLFWRPGEPLETLGPGHVILSALPLFHSYGQTCNQNATILGGGALTYLERFEPEAALELMARDGVTVFAGVPTMYFTLLNVESLDRFDLRKLRFCNSGGSAMPVEVMREFDQRFGVNILEGYGLSETSPIATFNVLFRPKKAGSIGMAIHGVEVHVVDDDDRRLAPGEVGEIVIRGPNVMKGYYRRPEATAEVFRNGWFHSGDLAYRDEDGYLFIVDRKKDMIIRGGFNVYPREVEEVLYSHPDVQEAAVVGVPSQVHGEEVKAFVALKPGSECTADDIMRHSKERLAASKYPREIEILGSLPKGPTGKILRKELRASSSREGMR